MTKIKTIISFDLNFKSVLKNEGEDEEESFERCHVSFFFYRGRMTSHTLVDEDTSIEAYVMSHDLFLEVERHFFALVDEDASIDDAECHHFFIEVE
jgi:hypothetical protein